mmetsp:Transcript_25312/g.30635  ORF Transcript_25312/g.30635 Transcript_25312/m.30635 type:complete len:221 (+) Transcript_25312:153-815(+)|eukprot:CAMPEP_0172497282 /NCGR_PEP_ID=MMETSP1066-20121228/97546_1 /TAXON_ID=671091 /ORGANISM="Coscinodiscus wailesii, Strain CCMP2513" /LENGTH=220 /DNA_ID=CAMNT_0013269947 /DNA_START=93 /DNA_END=755 /DNA_ORIENTATION=-
MLSAGLIRCASRGVFSGVTSKTISTRRTVSGISKISRSIEKTSRIIGGLTIEKRSLSSLPVRPFRILGVQQIAVGSLNKSGLTNLWTGILGLEKVGSYKSKKENVDEDILKLGGGGDEDSPHAIEVDLMVPLDPEASPKVHTPSLNHIGLWVDDLPSAVQWMTEQGVRFTPGGIRQGASGHNVTFIHPKGNDKCPIGGEGVLIELVQAPPYVVDALGKNN